MTALLITILIALALLIVIGVGLAVLIRACIQTVPSGHALIITTPSELRVAFNNRLVLPSIHSAELLDLTTRVITITRNGKDGLICRDNIRADLVVRFFVSIPANEAEVLKIAKLVGATRASNPDTMRELFEAKFSEALKTVGKQFDFDQLIANRDTFRDQTLATVGEDLNGFRLDDVVIDELDQTPIEQLDRDNILDAQGIKKLTEGIAHNQPIPNAAWQAAADRLTQQLNAQLTDALTNLNQRAEILAAPLPTSAAAELAQEAARASETLRSAHQSALDAELAALSNKMEADRRDLIDALTSSNLPEDADA